MQIMACRKQRESQGVRESGKERQGERESERAIWQQADICWCEYICPLCIQFVFAHKSYATGAAVARIVSIFIYNHSTRVRSTPLIQLSLSLALWLVHLAKILFPEEITDNYQILICTKRRNIQWVSVSLDCHSSNSLSRSLSLSLSLSAARVLLKIMKDYRSETEVANI